MNDFESWIIVGLGNPGPEYRDTRHNVGFLCLEEFARRHSLVLGPIRQGCRAAEGQVGGRTVVLIQPLLYMNRSGEALAAWARAADVAIATRPEDEGIRPLLVVDDIALPLGGLRLRSKGSDGGHRGLESITRVFGGDEYPRLRLGVGGRSGAVPPSVWADYVLQVFPDEDLPIVEELIERAVSALDAVVEQGTDWARNRFNRRRSPLTEPDPDEEDLQSGA